MSRALLVRTTLVTVTTISLVVALVCGCGSHAPTLPSFSGEPPARGGPSPSDEPDIAGSVLDPAGAAFGPVRVDTTDGEELRTDLANRSGGFLLPDVGPGRRVVSFAYPGYETSWEAVTLGDASVNIFAVMRAINSASPTEPPVIT
ncbi:MAG: carboxypeptidase regulatory-like domain-containing protein, partial [Armatimonadetes bacterium]|nr:carboxypeptidase regulatory-like domain-containing protein [Armatimonadota bacterium]